MGLLLARLHGPTSQAEVLRLRLGGSDQRRHDLALEVDETWVGGYQAGLKGDGQRKGRKAVLVAVAVEVRDDGRAGRLRLQVIPDDKGARSRRS